MDAPPPDAETASASPRWFTLDEMAAETGLNRDLITQFVPASTTPAGPIYGERQVEIAQVVKDMTGKGAPAAAIHAAVQDLWGYHTVHASTPTEPDGPRRTPWVGIGVAAAALMLAGVVGGAIGYRSGSGTQTGSAPRTVTVTAPPTEFSPTIPATPDPVCGAWTALRRDYQAKLTAWLAIDPAIPASQWTPEQRAVSTSAIADLRAEAADVRLLSERTQDPLLSALLDAQAMYEDQAAAQIPDYQASDGMYWGAVFGFTNAIDAICTAVAPR